MVAAAPEFDPGPAAPSDLTAPTVGPEVSRYGACLDSALAERDRIRGQVKLAVRERNQFWLILPEGVLPQRPGVEAPISYLRFSEEARRSIFLMRMVFNETGGIIADRVGGHRIGLEFRSCMLVGRTSAGGGLLRRLTSTELAPILAAGMDGGAIAASPVSAPSPDAAGGAASEIPDIGQLLTGLEETRASLTAIDSLLSSPDVLVNDEEERREELDRMAHETKDRALEGLNQLSQALNRPCAGSIEHWRAGITNALEVMIEAMVCFEDLAPHLREEKRRELEGLRTTIQSYIATIDPEKNLQQCRRFSDGVGRVILDGRKAELNNKKEKIKKNINSYYDDMVDTLQNSIGKGATIALVPHPYTTRHPEHGLRLILNMVHLALAVRYGGLSIALDTHADQRIYRELHGWDSEHPPALHIVGRNRFELLTSRYRPTVPEARSMREQRAAILAAAAVEGSLLSQGELDLFGLRAEPTMRLADS